MAGSEGFEGKGGIGVYVGGGDGMIAGSRSFELRVEV